MAQLKVELNISAELGQVSAAVQRAERIGFDGVTISEMGRDCLLASALACEHSSVLDVATEIALAFPRSPMITAMNAWELQRFSGNRFVLGLGTQVKGHIERRFSSYWDKPAAQMREYIESLRAIWSAFRGEGPLRYTGKYYNLSLLSPEFNPGGSAGDADVPVHIAAVNPLTARLAGQLCDGIRVHRFHSQAYLENVLRPAVQLGGEARDPNRTAPFEWCFMVMIVTGSSARELESSKEAARHSIAFYGSTRSYSRVTASVGGEHLVPELHELSLRGDWKSMPALIDDSLLEKIAVVGPHDELAGRLRERYAAVADRISVRLPSSDTATTQAWTRVLEDLKG